MRRLSCRMRLSVGMSVVSGIARFYRGLNRARRNKKAARGGRLKVVEAGSVNARVNAGSTAFERGCRQYGRHVEGPSASVHDWSMLDLSANRSVH